MTRIFARAPSLPKSPVDGHAPAHLSDEFRGDDLELIVAHRLHGRLVGGQGVVYLHRSVRRGVEEKLVLVAHGFIKIGLRRRLGALSSKMIHLKRALDAAFRKIPAIRQSQPGKQCRQPRHLLSGA